MCVDDGGDVFSTAAGSFKKGIGKWAFAKNTVYLRFLFGPLFADAGLDQHPLLSRVDKDAVHLLADPIQLIGRSNTLPKNARDDSIHRPSVQSKFTIGHYLDPIIA